MILLIDGYNLLKNITSHKYISEPFRNEFIGKLNKYSKYKGNKIIVVFDGGDFGYPYQEINKSVTIIYSGFNESADDVIKNYLTHNKNKDLMLVSSDNELVKFAKKMNITSIGVHDFYNILTEEKNEIESQKISDNILYKTTSKISQELDALMLEAAENIRSQKEDTNIDRKNISTNKLSKKDKKLKQKLKKL